MRNDVFTALKMMLTFGQMMLCLSAQMKIQQTENKNRGSSVSRGSFFIVLSFISSII